MEDNEDDIDEINYRTICGFFLFGIIFLILTIILFGLFFGYIPSKSGILSVIAKPFAFIFGVVTLILSIGLFLGAFSGIIIKIRSMKEE